MVSENYLQGAGKLFHFYRDLADRAIAQMGEEHLFEAPTPESNSVAVIAKHLAGNMISRWTDFLTTDGEKPWRNRDSEFEDDFSSRAELLERWDEGWTCLFDAIAKLTPEDLERTVAIRGEPHTVVDAINRQMTHTAYHVGQIVFVARMLVGESWQSLSVPKGKSQE